MTIIWRYDIVEIVLGGQIMNMGINYKLFYEILLHLREDYHSYGRIDDSNAKLDEIVKLIMYQHHKWDP